MCRTMRGQLILLHSRVDCILLSTKNHILITLYVNLFTIFVEQFASSKIILARLASHYSEENPI